MEKTGRSVRPPRSRPLAIVVSKGGEEFPELLKTIRRTVDPKVTGNAITKMRRTGKNELLIEINGGTDSAENVRAEVERSLGSDAKVRKLEETSPVEIRDLDEETTKEEILDAVNAYAGGSTARVVSMRKVFGGAQTALVVLPSTEAKRLCAEGRLRVGLVYARIRHTEIRERCYRCLSFGHWARSCGGVDRSACCFRCGAEGHFSRNCTATIEAAAAFKATLAGPPRGESGMTTTDVAADTATGEVVIADD